MLDVAICNAWLLYRRDLTLMNESVFMPLRSFRANVARGLIQGKPVRGRPSLDDAPEPPKRIQRTVAPRPEDSCRFDGLAHWPVHCEKSRCRICPKGWTRMKCDKCNMALCINAERNCFVSFHNK